jgi:hypothetical protein
VAGAEYFSGPPQDVYANMAGSRPESGPTPPPMADVAAALLPDVGPPQDVPTPMPGTDPATMMGG